ncbi:hypothetical protein [Sphingomonas sp.]|jgi:hypothetical protein|uniref:DUF6932 family protein n=1 Tax=Sphingomonas sp. TaxID=28214 RepID=UPI003567A9F4
MIPECDERGYLPAGVHDASWQEFAERYAVTEHRRALTDKLALLVRHLKAVGCRALCRRQLRDRQGQTERL